MALAEACCVRLPHSCVREKRVESLVWFSCRSLEDALTCCVCWCLHSVLGHDQMRLINSNCHHKWTSLFVYEYYWHPYQHETDLRKCFISVGIPVKLIKKWLGCVIIASELRNKIPKVWRSKYISRSVLLLMCTFVQVRRYVAVNDKWQVFRVFDARVRNCEIRYRKMTGVFQTLLDMSSKLKCTWSSGLFVTFVNNWNVALVKVW
jgi:hypothetical protein